MSPSVPSGPLAGYRVIDLSTIVLGPYASMQLADMGADVIKVEAPPGGDAYRSVKPARNAGMSGPFINLNRNKRSIVLDLKQTAGRAVLERLIAGADVFFHNMRPRAIAGLDLGYEQVAGLRPDIVYCGAQGYGRRGPYRDRPAYDDIVQGESGLAGLNARIAGAPTYAPTIIADKLVGMAASQAMVMALLHRERTGQGQEVEVPMFETMAAFILAEHLSGRVFEPPLGNTGYGRVASPYRRPYKARDGYVCVLPYTDDQWRRFFALAGRSELSDDPRFDHMSARSDNIDELYELLEQIIAGRSVGEWLELCAEAQVPAGPINDTDDLLADEHLAAVDFFKPFDHPSEGAIIGTDISTRFAKSPGSIRLPAPRLGQHGREILAELDYSEDEMETLAASGAVPLPQES